MNVPNTSLPELFLYDICSVNISGSIPESKYFVSSILVFTVIPFSSFAPGLTVIRGILHVALSKYTKFPCSCISFTPSFPYIYILLSNV